MIANVHVQRTTWLASVMCILHEYKWKTRITRECEGISGESLGESGEESGSDSWRFEKRHTKWTRSGSTKKQQAVEQAVRNEMVGIWKEYERHKWKPRKCNRSREPAHVQTTSCIRVPISGRTYYTHWALHCPFSVAARSSARSSTRSCGIFLKWFSPAEYAA